MSTLPLCHIPIKEWRQSSEQAEGKEPPSLGSGGPSLTAIGLTNGKNVNDLGD